MNISPLTTHHSPAVSRRAFTLVEMLVALALTLILVYAIAHFYAIVGDSVKDGRAMIEMNQQLRAAVERLKSDLDLVTVPVVPWADEGGAAGFLEIKEGLSTDWDVNANFTPDAEFEFVDLNGDGILDSFGPDVTNLLSDCDDFLGMTIRSAGTPFTGQSVRVVGPPLTASGPNDGLVMARGYPTSPVLQKIDNPPQTYDLTSPYAEVVWWTSFRDDDLDGFWDMNEPRQLHRRQLLIRPDLNLAHAGDTTTGRPANYFCRVQRPAPLLNPMGIYLYDVHQYCDVSIRPAGEVGGYLYFVANSLSDLCKRQNRFMHISPIYDGTTPGASFPYALDLNPNFAGSLNPNLMPDNQADVATTQARHAAANGNPGTFNWGSQYRWVLFDGGRKGEDVILPNVLAFDIRVYDPDAVIRPDLAGATYSPGDAGYAYANSFNYMTAHAPFGGPAAGLPTGAYVDLGYGAMLSLCLPNLTPPHRISPNGLAYSVLFQSTLGVSRFADAAAVAAPFRARLGFTYDTWTLAYERDGINQDAAFEGTPIIDQGTDGLDNLVPNPAAPPPLTYLNGVDDAGERETSPPYPHPLRGVQIRIRMYEPGTRQTRQATVIGDFVSE